MSDQTITDFHGHRKRMRSFPDIMKKKVPDMCILSFLKDLFRHANTEQMCIRDRYWSRASADIEKTERM